MQLFLFGLQAILVAQILAQAIPPSPVYVLNIPNNPTALRAVSSALHTLGYAYSAFELGVSSSSSSSSRRNAALGVGQKSSLTYGNISRADPDARFILPVTRSSTTSPASSSWFGGFLSPQTGRESRLSDEAPGLDSIREFFADRPFGNGKPRLYELDVSPLESRACARALTKPETWVALCDFLGLGYSIVERLKLRRFPL
ncbi:hypothetical protein F5B17DRAFT_418224 [Nemania serpens]|nr:hypothetical protein F5B17DRAFT_418224 [Nemania serpens]